MLMFDFASMFKSYGQTISSFWLFSYFFRLTDFEYTSGLVIFDVIGVELIHGWLIPETHPNYNIISKYSYNQAVEKIIIMRTLMYVSESFFLLSRVHCEYID